MEFVGKRRAVLAGSLILVAAISCSPVSPPPREVRLIREYRGELEPAAGDVAVKVFRITAPPAGMIDLVLQNRIEVTRGGTTTAFEWPDEKTFAAYFCDILDLDGDGTKEFVLGAGPFLRVVSHKNGAFQYRIRNGGQGDELLSRSPIDVIDLDGDGHLEFMITRPRTIESIGKEPPQLEIFEWTFANGFGPGTESLKSAYQSASTAGEWSAVRAAAICLASQSWVLDEWRAAGLNPDPAKPISFRAARGSVAGMDPNPSEVQVVFYSTDETRGWLGLAYVEGETVEAVRNGYHLTKDGSRWIASEGNGGIATYTAMGRRATEIASRPKFQVAPGLEQPATCR